MTDLQQATETARRKTSVAGGTVIAAGAYFLGAAVGVAALTGVGTALAVYYALPKMFNFGSSAG